MTDKDIILELEKKIDSLMLILKSHGEICEMNHELRRENRKLKNELQSITDLKNEVSYGPV